MLKKLMLATMATLLLVPADALAKKKCKSFCSVNTQTLRVCGNAVVNGNLTVDGTINNTDITNIINTLDAIQSDFIFAYSTTPQLYAGAGTAFQKILFNVNGPLDGWLHTVGTGDFTVPATGLYLISYSANLGVAVTAGTDTVPGAVAAFLGTLGSEVQIAGSDSVVQLTVGTTTNILTASSSFLLNATAGQNLYFGLLGTDDNNVTLTSTELLEVGTDTTIAISITRIR